MGHFYAPSPHILRIGPPILQKMVPTFVYSHMYYYGSILYAMII